MTWPDDLPRPQITKKTYLNLIELHLAEDKENIYILYIYLK